VKVSLAYPKIPDSTDFRPRQCIAFEKYDGTNLHWIWSVDGWKSFGTRRSRFDFTDDGIAEFCQEHHGLEEAPVLFRSSLFETLGHHLSKQQVTSVVCFTEFWGANSFAGHHKQEDIKHLTLIDVCMDGKMLPPNEFIKLFSGFPIANVVYQGKYNGQFVEDVRNGKFKVNEGVVCKGVGGGALYMAKIKTDDYLNRLKNNFPNTWSDHWE